MVVLIALRMVICVILGGGMSENRKLGTCYSRYFATTNLDYAGRFNGAGRGSVSATMFGSLLKEFFWSNLKNVLDRAKV